MMGLTRIGIEGLTMGCKDDDTCDQPVTKGDLEKSMRNNFLALMFVYAGFTYLIVTN